MNEKIVPVSENCLNHCVTLMAALSIHQLIDDELVEVDSNEDLEETTEEVYVKAEFSQIISAGYSDNYQSGSKLKEPESSEDLVAPAESESENRTEDLAEYLTLFAKDVAQAVIDAGLEDKAEVLDQKFQELYDKAIGKIICDKVIKIDEGVIIPFCPLKEYVTSNYQK